MLSHARISTGRVMAGPWHRIEDINVRVASTFAEGRLPTTCGLELPMIDLSYAQMGYDRRFDVECGDCVKAEALRLIGIARSMQERGYRSIDGYCRHGQYVGGSGIDWMCGTCENYSLDEEVAEIRAMAANVLREARYS